MKKNKETSGSNEIPSTTTEEELLTTSDARKVSDTFITALAQQDFTTMANTVSLKGVRVSNYTNISDGDITLTATQLKNARNDTTKYTWGYGSGSGLPIEYTISDYFSKTLYNKNYAAAEDVYINELVFGSGQGGTNLKEAYPNAIFIEYYLPDTETNRWSALILALQQENGSYKLVGISRAYWTI